MNYKILWIFLVFLIIFFIRIIYENKNPIKTKIDVYKNLRSDINKLKILQISDLHNYKFGKKQSRLLNLVDDDYDFIFITGDLIDRRYPNINIAMDLIDGLKGDIFFVKGNHEKGYDGYNNLEKLLLKRNIKILNNDIYKVKNSNINIIGLEDPSEYSSINKKIEKDEYGEINNNLNLQMKKIDNIDKKEKSFNILLSHRPEFFNLYVKNDLDIVFSGHTHGGQIRIFNRGLFSPDQGFFAKYSGGVFNKDNTTMINSRGLGNNFFFVKRVFNRPHIIEVNIYNKSC